VFGLRGTGATPSLGVTVQDPSGLLGNYFGAPDGQGILVMEVLAGLPSEKAGIKAGDVITKVDGERVRNTAELRNLMRNKRNADSVALGVLRKGTEASVNVMLEKRQTPQRGPERLIPL
jgi:S1-C subfamily serine protease